MPTREVHRGDRIGWLRASVIGANDGVLSTASLIVGVAAAHVAPRKIMVAGIAGLVAGAMSIAAGESVSVSSQADTEKADKALKARPIQAALASAATFAVGAALPLLAAIASPRNWIIRVVITNSLHFLGVLGGVAARVGGAPTVPGANRVMLWGALAMGLMAGVGALFGTAM